MLDDQQQKLVNKLGFNAINEMQAETLKQWQYHKDLVLLSPTGSGKTLAFLLPMLEKLDSELQEIQAMIVTPTRELAMQIEQVLREMGTGHKVNTVYGGKSRSQDKRNLKHIPSILIGTPGRISDHISRENIELNALKIMVLDEYDKSLEIGFEEQLRDIMDAIPSSTRKILTSATKNIELPDFAQMHGVFTLDFLNENKPDWTVKLVASPTKDKLSTLTDLLASLDQGSCIIFCNFKDSLSRISEHLSDHRFPHSAFHGSMEQVEREINLVKFRNGTHNILLATDLAARGIDIPEINHIIHYHLPVKETEFIHRNGRTARMHRGGNVYLIQYKGDPLPEYIREHDNYTIEKSSKPSTPEWTTLQLSAGRKSKISKGDIAGYFFRQGQLKPDELGLIEIHQDISYVAVPSHRTSYLIKTLDNGRLKKVKIRIKIL